MHTLDYLGQLGIAPSSSPTVGKCGWFQTYVDFTGLPGKGWLIQHVKKSVIITEEGMLYFERDPVTRKLNCECRDCGAIKKPEEVVEREFYEAFWYGGVGQVFPDGSVVHVRDVSSGRSEGTGRCKSGTVFNRKTAVWYGQLPLNNEGCPQGFTKKGNLTGAGTCASKGEPSDWDKKNESAPTVTYGFKGTWDCCPNLKGATSFEQL